MAHSKTCFKCEKTLPCTEFYKHPQMGDGYLGKCKECNKKDAAEHRALNIEKIREYDRKRASEPHRRALAIKVGAKWREENPLRKKAQTKVSNAIRDGKIIKLPCLICGKKSEAHHPDYSRPLDVVWLCSSHHKQAHAIANKFNRSKS